MRMIQVIVLALALTVIVSIATRADKQADAGANAVDRRETDWRTFSLANQGAVDKAWTLVGYGGFVVDAGALRTEPDERGMGLLVYTREKFGDCQLRVVYKTKDAKSNAGVFVRIDDGILARLDSKAAPAKRDKDGKLPKAEIAKFQKASEKGLGAWWPVHHAYEIQICDTGDAYHRTGAVYSLAKAAALPASEQGGWRTMLITLDANRILVDVDGKRASVFDPDAKDIPPQQKWSEPQREPKRPLAGYIGLQVHDPGDIVWFKEISVRPLAPAK